jgi:ABC-type transporter Mla subunit MlaD
VVKKLLSALLFVSFLLPPPLLSQTIEENLLTLGNLIDSSLSSIETTATENEALKTTLENLEGSLKTQSALLREQGRLLNEQAANYNQQQQIYEAQKSYLGTLRTRSNAYKWSLIIAVPICTGLGAWLGWKLGSRK